MDDSLDEITPRPRLTRQGRPLFCTASSPSMPSLITASRRALTRPAPQGGPLRHPRPPPSPSRLRSPPLPPTPTRAERSQVPPQSTGRDAVWRGRVRRGRGRAADIMAVSGGGVSCSYSLCRSPSAIDVGYVLRCGTWSHSGTLSTLVLSLREQKGEGGRLAETMAPSSPPS